MKRIKYIGVFVQSIIIYLMKTNLIKYSRSRFQLCSWPNNWTILYILFFMWIYTVTSSFCMFSGKRTKRNNFSPLHTIQIIALFACYWISSNMKIVNCLSFYLLRLPNSYASFYLSHKSPYYYTLVRLLFCTISTVCTYLLCKVLNKTHARDL